MHVGYFCFFTFLTLFHPTLSIRLTSKNETDLAQTEEPYTGPNPWSEIPCDFDGYSMCGWTNEHGVPDDFDWRLGDGKDSHRNRRRQKTGVKTDHGTGGGYMYILSGRSRNRTAKLTTGFFRITEPGCLKFFYHMRGRHMGHLKLYEFVTPRKVRHDFERQMDKYDLLWSVYGNQGQNWQQGVVPISKIDSSLRKRLVFEGFDWDAGVAGNIVLDDISFDAIEDGRTCNFSPLDAAPPATTTTPVTTTSPSTTTHATETLPIVTSSTKGIPGAAIGDGTTSVPLPAERNSTQPSGPFVASSGIQRSRNLTSVTMPKKESIATTAGKLVFRTTSSEVTTENGVEAKSNHDDPVIYIVVGVVCAILVIGVALALYWRHKKRNQFTYYDNCTVHMTRMSQDAVDPKDAVMQYYKLTDSDGKY